MDLELGLSEALPCDPIAPDSDKDSELVRRGTDNDPFQNLKL